MNIIDIAPKQIAKQRKEADKSVVKKLRFTGIHAAELVKIIQILERKYDKK